MKRLRSARFWIVAASVFVLAGLVVGQEPTRRVRPPEPQLPTGAIVIDRGGPTPLNHAHAHNDYLHARPLFDALDRGFMSVEADIHLVEGRLLVAHDADKVRPDRTLEGLYLDPLLKRVQTNRGKVYLKGPEFTLLIDIKTDGPKTYAVLKEVLPRYAAMLTQWGGDEVRRKAVTVIISGNRTREMIEGDAVRYAALDGLIADLDKNPPLTLVPLISDRWGAHFQWEGEGEMPEAERTKLRGFAKKAHDQGRRLRFWATRDLPSVWRELYLARVDLINTDDLAGVQKFLLAQTQP